MLIEYEVLFRAVVFAAVLLPMALLECFKPAQPLRFNKWLRWRHNFTLLGVYTLVIRLAFPIALSGFAAFVHQQQLGVLSELPLGLNILLSVVALDFVIYWQHRAMHRFNFLWKVHQIHHSDADLDVSTAVRFHPLEILISLLIKMLAIVVLGAHPVAVILFELLLNGFALFNHSNTHIPPRWDRYLRMFCVTPNMHRIHHSQEVAEHNSNYGFAFSLWDRLFASYRKKAKYQGAEFALGLPQWKNRVYDFAANERMKKLLTMKLGN